jgi:hypothetical protein
MWSTIKTALAAIFVPLTRTINGVDLSANRSLLDLGVSRKRIGYVSGSNVAELEITGLSGYSTLWITPIRILTATNAADLGIQFGTSGGYDTGSNYVWRVIYDISGLGVSGSNGTSTTGFLNTYDNTAGYGADGELKITNFNVPSGIARISGTMFGRRGGADSETVNSILHGTGGIGSAVRDRLRIKASTGNITGAFLIEGLTT